MRISGSTRARAIMKAVVSYAGALLLCAGLAVAQSGGGTNPKPSSRMVNEPSLSSSSRLLQRAGSDWTNFLKGFRLALRSHDLKALYSMTSEKFRENCVLSNGRDIRKKFFSDNSGFDHYLEILTPGH